MHNMGAKDDLCTGQWLSCSNIPGQIDFCKSPPLDLATTSDANHQIFLAEYHCWHQGTLCFSCSAIWNTRVAEYRYCGSIMCNICIYFTQHDTGDKDIPPLMGFIWFVRFGKRYQLITNLFQTEQYQVVGNLHRNK